MEGLRIATKRMTIYISAAALCFVVYAVMGITFTQFIEHEVTSLQRAEQFRGAGTPEVVQTTPAPQLGGLALNIESLLRLAR